VWKTAPDFATAAECWLMAGGPHHTVLSTAIGNEALEDFALMADIELVRIDQSVTTSGFIQTLRWNQAYYRFSQASL
jgi:L-arabinose isomerase